MTLQQSQLNVLECFKDSRILRANGNTCKFLIEYSSELDQPPKIRMDEGVASFLLNYILSLGGIKYPVHISCRRPLQSYGVFEHLSSKGIPIISVDFMLNSLIDQLPQIKPYLNQIKYIFLNEFEMTLLMKDLNSATIDSTLIITQGSRGAYAMRHGNVLCRISAKPVAAIDVTGAGDIFAGAFLASIEKGLVLKEALIVASSWAGRSVSDYGVLHLLGGISA